MLLLFVGFHATLGRVEGGAARGLLTAGDRADAWRGNVLHALIHRPARQGSHLGAVALLGEQDVGRLQVAVHHLQGAVTMQARDPKTASRTLGAHHKLDNLS